MNTIHLVPVQGRVPYEEGLEWQRELASAKISGEVEEDFVLLLEHEPVVTLGRGAREGNVLAAPEVLEAAGVPTVEVERGGDVTYHGPGQLVGYPILDLNRWKRDLHWYLRQLEQALVDALRELGSPAFRYPGLTGVWVGDESAVTDAGRGAGRVRKIASLGVHVSRWVTWHGFALNVTNGPLDNFGLILPCGIDEVHMTTLESERAISDWKAVSRAVGRGLASAFECEARWTPPARAGERPLFDPVGTATSRA